MNKIITKAVLVLVSAFFLYWLFIQVLTRPTYSEGDLHRERVRAVAQARDGDLPSALKRLQELAQFAKTHQPLWQDYAIVLSWDGQDARALGQLAHIDLSQSPDYFIDDMLAASGREGDAERAQVLSTEAARRDPPLYGAIRRTAGQFEQKGDDSTAKRLDSLLPTATTQGHDKGDAPRLASTPKIPEKAPRETVRNESKQTPLSQEALEQVAWEARSQGRCRIALTSYEEGQRRFPGNRQFALGEALCLIELNRPGEAMKKLNDLQAQFPDARDIKKARVYAARQLSDLKQALSLQTDLLSDSPDLSEDSLVWLAVTEQYHGDDEAGMRRALEKQLRRQPDNHWIREALLVRQAWGGELSKALAHLSRLDPERMSERALEASAFSARHTAESGLAERLYRTGQRRFPHNRQFTRGLALSLAQSGETDDGEKVLATLDENKVTGKDGLAVAESWATLGNYIKAQEIFHSEYLKDRESRKALEGWLINLSRSGLAGVAYRESLKAPLPLSNETKAELMARYTAYTLARSQSDEYLPSQRRAIAEEALQTSEQTVEFIGRTMPEDDRRLFHAESDRIRALANLEKSREVADAFEFLRSHFEHEPSIDLKLEAAAAYLDLEQPELAEGLAFEVLAVEPEQYDAHNTVYFAQLDQEQYEAAHRTLIDMRSYQPEWRTSADGRIQRPNPDRLAVERSLAMHRAYENDLEGAQEALDQMIGRAPANTDLIVDRSTVYRWRGWLRTSQRDIDAVLRNEPLLYGARQGRFYNAMAQQDYTTAKAEMVSINTDFPGLKGTLKVNEAWRLHQRQSFNVEAGWRKGRGSRFESQDWQLEARYYTSPWQENEHYRGFARSRLLLSDFSGSSKSIERAGFGLEYRDAWGRWQAELSQSLSSDDPGASVSLVWQISDQWQASSGFQSYSDQTPVRAAAADISLSTLDFGLSYIPSEKQGYSVSYSLGEFSDDNVRTQYGLSAYQQIHRDPRHLWRVHEYMSVQSNDLLNAPYYNPEQATTLGLGLEYIGVIHRRYSRHFKQRMRLDVSQTAEKNFSAGTGWGLEYEHLWQRSTRFDWHYGVGLGGAVYDGASEDYWRLFGGLTWRF